MAAVAPNRPAPTTAIRINLPFPIRHIEKAALAIGHDFDAALLRLAKEILNSWTLVSVFIVALLHDAPEADCFDALLFAVGDGFCEHVGNRRSKHIRAKLAVIVRDFRGAALHRLSEAKLSGRRVLHLLERARRDVDYLVFRSALQLFLGIEAPTLEETARQRLLTPQPHNRHSRGDIMQIDIGTAWIFERQVHLEALRYPRQHAAILVMAEGRIVWRTRIDCPRRVTIRRSHDGRGVRADNGNGRNRSLRLRGDR